MSREEDEIIEAAQLPESEKIYLKKDWLGYRIVYPRRNPDGTLNWSNILFGGKRNGVRLLCYLFLIAALYVGVNDLISSYQTVAANPCEFCSACFDQVSSNDRYRVVLPK